MGRAVLAPQQLGVQLDMQRHKALPIVLETSDGGMYLENHKKQALVEWKSFLME